MIFRRDFHYYLLYRKKKHPSQGSKGIYLPTNLNTNATKHMFTFRDLLQILGSHCHLGWHKWRNALQCPLRLSYDRMADEAFFAFRKRRNIKLTKYDPS